MPIIPPPRVPPPRRAPLFSLPPYRFVPKLYPHPLKHPEGHLYGKENLWSSFSEHSRWNIGVDLFNNHYFWEAHEVWEGLWKEKQATERDFLQSMILLSAALLQEHLGRENISKKSQLRAQSLLSDTEKWSLKYQLDILALFTAFTERSAGGPFPKMTVPHTSR